ncbi:MAG: glycine zipper 2TM domain-containing protein [Gammaproteobacteria bacterium]|nr:glycine zipper 2TM domain-containing protein [Gammaproteobacteria bacterium]MCP5298819.1 glycine zipper 2TM domain-containing protein [Chromatiaceae bacterium]
MNQTIRNTILAALLCGIGSAHAGNHDGPGRGFGQVLQAKPIYETVTVHVPEQRCWNTYDAAYDASYGDDRSNTVVGTVIGGVVGGVVGNQFGRGDGRTAMTVAGTVLGAVIGNRIASDASAGDDTRCATVERDERRRELVGYRVKYRYRGHVYVTRTDYDPGKRIRVDREPRSVNF